MWRRMVRSCAAICSSCTNCRSLVSSAAAGIQRLVDIVDDVVDMLDADAQPDHLRPDAGLTLLVRRHLPVRRRSRMAGERLGVAHVHETLDQLERVVEPLTGREAATDTECQKRAGPAAEILGCEGVMGTLWKAGIVDPVDARVVTQELGHAAG